MRGRIDEGITQWYTSPELISLSGTEVYERLNEPARQRLSFYEAVNFFSLNLHDERFLIQGLAQRLYRHDTSDLASYLHHFLDEENKHMVYFGRFCLQYAGKVYPDRTLVFPRDYAPGEEDVLFFTRVLIFEEIVDAYNLSMANDARLVPIVRQINALHHREETRHLLFGRAVVARLFAHYHSRWSTTILSRMRQHIQDYLGTTWKAYYNPAVYRDAGIDDALGVYERAFQEPRCRAHRQTIAAPCARYLVDLGLLEETPCL